MINILIVEDDVKIAEIQRIFVEKIDGYTVTGIAHSISEAEEMVFVLEPDLVLLDIFLPDGNGIEFLWKIRSALKKTDVVLITAAKEVEFFEEAMRGGVFDYILKPLVFSRFKKTLDEFKKHRSKLEKISTISQGEIDRLLHQTGAISSEEEEMPKGIDPITLNKVSTILTSDNSEGLSAEKAGRLIGVSRTTSRRYLEYLVAKGTAIADLCYGAQGRPERVYRKT
jgi:two-component system CitB family response regulator